MFGGEGFWQHSASSTAQKIKIVFTDFPIDTSKSIDGELQKSF